MKRVLTAALCLVLLSGCLGGSDIRSRAMVQLFGIDYEGGNFHVTLQLFNPTGQSDEGGDDDKQVVRAEGATLSEALANASLRVGRRTFLGDCRAVVVGEKAAAERMDYILRYLSDDREVYPQVAVLMAVDTAAEVVAPEVDEDETYLANSLENITNSSVAGDAQFPSNLLLVCKGFFDEGAASVLRVETLRQDGEVLVEPAGVAVFVEDAPAVFLDRRAERGLLYLRGLGVGTIIGIDDPDYGTMAIELQKVNVKIKAAVQGGLPSFDVALDVQMSVAELLGHAVSGFDEAALRRITQRCEAAIRGDIEACLSALQPAGADAVGFYRHLRRQEPTFYKYMHNNWSHLFADASVAVRVDGSLRRIGNA